MSDYGSDKNVDMNIAQKLAFEFGFVPLDSANVMQWAGDTDAPDIKIADRKSGTNIHFRFEK